MIIPTILWGALIGFVLVIIWCIKRKKVIPGIETSIMIIISTIGISGGVAYCFAGILNYLHQNFDKIPAINITNEEFYAVLFLSGIIFIIVGLHEFYKSWRRKK